MHVKVLVWFCGVLLSAEPSFTRLFCSVSHASRLSVTRGPHGRVVAACEHIAGTVDHIVALGPEQRFACALTASIGIKTTTCYESSKSRVTETETYLRTFATKAIHSPGTVK